AAGRARGLRQGRPTEQGTPAHGHYLQGRAPVAAGDARAHARPAARVAVRGAPLLRAVRPGELGRRHLRRGAALPARVPLGAAGVHAPPAAQRALPDAAARRQRRRLHQLPGQRRLQ
ncbi:Protein of unknown function, partial [Gryllus bimaculatus]